MSEIGNFSDDPDIGRLDPVALASALRGGLGGGAEQREKLAGLRGKADSTDGLVHVEVDAQGRLADVRLDPKAMRVASVDLSATIVRLAREAGADVARRLEDEIGDLRGLARNFDPASIKARMDEVSADFDRMAANARSEAEERQRRTR